MSKAVEKDEEVVRGVVKRITFRNPENGYSVLQLSVAEATDQLTVVGNCNNVDVGLNLIVRGQYTDHPKFGKQLSARAITVAPPQSEDDITRYLGSGVFKGIGPKTAEKLVDAFGTDTLETIYRYPDRIAKIPGIGARKAERIAERLAERKEMRDIEQFLMQHNIGVGLTKKIYDRYSTKAVEILAKDPYLLSREVRGIGFATADSIALNMGLDKDSPQRLKAGLYFALERARDEGHCFLPMDTLLQRASFLLGLEEGADLSEHIYDLVRDDFLICDEERVYLKRLHSAECFVADFVAERAFPLEGSIIPEKLVERSLSNAEQAVGFSFSFEQKQAVLDAVRHPLMLITGGPGCGKTTIIRALVQTFQDADKVIALAAPTGRAAQRMTQVCGITAKTIHRLLRFDPMRNSFLYGPNEPLEVEGRSVQAVIIDEASMIDLLLARDLFSAIPSDAVVILVGDKDQLPSVGPGRVFGDLIERREIKTVALSQLFRREEASTINTVAHMINAGVVPEIPEPDGVTKADAYFLPRPDPESAGSTVEKLVSDQLPKKFQIDISDIVVLTPSNRGPLGTIALNERLQNCLNPHPAGTENEITVNKQVLRVGDRVCQRVNNYQIDAHGVFNGDVGTIYSIDRANRSLVVEMWDGRLIKYESGDLGQLSLAYAVTVHRSQGTEIPCVVMVLHESHYTLLERQLIYTGVTRAKQLLVVVGSKRALFLASKRTRGHKRCTHLSERVETLVRNL